MNRLNSCIFGAWCQVADIKHCSFIMSPFFVLTIEWRTRADRRKQQQKRRRWKRKIHTGGRRMKTQTLRPNRTIPSLSCQVRQFLSLRPPISFDCSDPVTGTNEMSSLPCQKLQAVTESNWAFQERHTMPVPFFSVFFEALLSFPFYRTLPILLLIYILWGHLLHSSFFFPFL